MMNVIQENVCPDYLSAVALSLVQLVGVLGNTLVICSICSPNRSSQKYLLQPRSVFDRLCPTSPGVYFW